MNDNFLPGPDSSPSEELHGLLRQAVTAIHKEPVPSTALERSLDNARNIPLPRKGFLHRNGVKIFVVGSGIAAALLVTVNLALGPNYKMGLSQEAWYAANTPNGGETLGGGLYTDWEGGDANVSSSSVVRNQKESTSPSRGAPSGSSSMAADNLPRDKDAYINNRRLSIPPFGGFPSGEESKRLSGPASGPDVSHLTSLPSTMPLTQKPKTPPASKVWRQSSGQPSVARVSVGNGQFLDLISLEVTTTVEGPRARTVVDYIFRNPHERQLEGTFEYPLPTSASPSYFAMLLGPSRETAPPRFTGKSDVPALGKEASALTPESLVHASGSDWGNLKEAHVVSRTKALENYEDTVRGRIDPGLIEYAGANTFSGRVFPIQPHGFNRIVFAYEELLPYADNNLVYRFPLPEGKLQELGFHLRANTADFSSATLEPADAAREEGAGQRTYSRTWKEQGPGGEVHALFVPRSPSIQALSGRRNDNGPIYLYARLRPDLKGVAAQAFADHAVFLLDASLSEHPERFDRNVKLLRKILETDPAIKHFNILAFNIGVSWVEPGHWLDNTPEGRERAFARLEGTVLEGATDLSAALDKLLQPPSPPPAGAALPIFLLSDGQITWGEPDVNRLVARFEARCPWSTRFFCYRTGLGAENLELFDALTRKGGGIFNAFTAELTAAAAAHRQECLQVEKVRLTGGPAANDLLVAGRQAAVYPDGDLVLATRMTGTGQTTAVIEGTFLGKKFVQEFPLKIDSASELAPRGWGEIAVSSLLALDDSHLDGLVAAYCQEFGIASRVASFLILENENDFKRFNLEEERGKTLPGGDLPGFLQKAWENLGRAASPREAFVRLLNGLRNLGPQGGGEGEHLRKLLALLADSDFELPDSSPGEALAVSSSVPPDYLNNRQGNRENVNLYVAEARRRADAQDLWGAVRVLSSIVEVFPARADALRMVGYRLLDLHQPVAAARLFRQVQSQRPFEPHSYLDLARALEDCGKFNLAAAQYEIVLSGVWHNRFQQSLKEVAREDYAHLMRSALRQANGTRGLAGQFEERLKTLDANQGKSDLRVAISWNTDATDVDLWVIEPDGSKCFYSNAHTASGGQLTQDQTQGYGPERYQIVKARSGVYKILVNYFAENRNLLGGETNVNVIITRFAGTPEETSERHTIILKKARETVEVAEVKF